MNIVIIGAQWGDEGKGKVVDLLSDQAEYVVRFQGGNNAGHTVIIKDDIFKLHHIPSGIFRDKKCVLGNGVVINPDFFINEVKQLEDKGYNLTNKLFISEKAHIITPEHQARDKKQEDSREQKVGTTGKGIGPTYTDKVSRQGIRFWEFRNNPDLISEYKELYDKIIPFVTDTFEMLHGALENKSNILFEGAQGTFLDIDHGTYPYVTSSNTVSAGACTGSGVPPTSINRVVGVLKAYTTRVGNGPFPCELNDEVGAKLVKNGKEFGTTTGRQRRCGWLDLVMANYARKVNGISSWVITKLDVLNDFEELKVCIGYKLDGIELKGFPAGAISLEKVEPIYKTFKGWNTSLENCKNFEDLPKEAKEYLSFISDFTKTPLGIVSIGPERNQNIVLTNLWQY